MATDIAPHQQAAIIVLNLSGEARALARQIGTNELANGGMYEGRMLDPVTYLFKQLQKRFGMLTAEKRMIAVSNFDNFRRHPHESVDAVFTRFERLKYLGGRTRCTIHAQRRSAH